MNKRVTVTFVASMLMVVAGASAQDGCDHPLFGNPEFFLNDEPRAMTTADLDGDGDLDVVVFTSSNNQSDILVLLNDGSGLFARTAFQFDFPDGNVDRDGVAIVDVDGDLDPDIVALAGEALWILRNDGKAEFAPDPVYTLPQHRRGIALADFDGDDDQDIVVLGNDDQMIMLNDGTGLFSLGPRFDHDYAYDRPTEAAAADVDGDGDIDLAVITIHQFSDQVLAHVLLNSGDAEFSIAGSIALADLSWGVALEDLNRDGLPELLVSADNDLAVLDNLGAGTFGVPTMHPVGEWAGGIATGDANGDGHTDVLVPDYEAYEVVLFFGHGDGTLGQPIKHHVGYKTRLPHFGDFNGDGAIDIVVAARNEDTVCLLFNQGCGDYAAVDVYDTPSEPGVVSHDYDGDGDVDLAVVDPSSQSVTLLRNAGNGTFTADPPLLVPGEPELIATGDFDGDGAFDVVVADTTNNTVSIAINDGAGAFSVYASFPVGDSPILLAADDINDDGLADLVLAHLWLVDLTVLLNTGDLTFNQVSAPGVLEAQAMALHDVNGDGFPDVLIAPDPNPDRVFTFLNDGAGNFINFTYSQVGADPRCINVIDVIDDANEDLVVTCYNEIWILKGWGSGHFTPSIVVNSGSIFTKCSVGDLNGDGIHDLIAGIANGTRMRVYLGAADEPHYEQFVAYGTGARSGPFLLEDFDNDTDIDIAMASDNLNDDVGGVSVFLSLCADDRCPGDVTDDGVVNAADLSVILGNWGPLSPPDSRYDLAGDDCAANAGDLAVVLGNWGPCW